MDHISKALERAKSEPESVRSWVRPEVPEVTSDVSRADPTIGAAVDLDRDLARANHVLSDRAEDDPMVTDKYRLLRTRLLQLMAPRGWRKLGITSPGPKAGKTLSTLNLGISIARDRNHRVILVDGDLRKPALAQTLGIQPRLGIIDYLARDASLDDIAIAPRGLDRVTIIPGHEAESGAEAPDYLRSKRMGHLLTELENHDESTVIIVDLPPVLIGDDVIAVASLLDSMLLVIDEGGTDLEELKDTAELLKPFNLIGTLLNKSTERAKETGGYYLAYHS